MKASMSIATARREAQKQELSCSNLVPMLRYLENHVGIESAHRAIEQLGLPISFLRNKKNWISYHYYNRFLETGVDLTGDEWAPYKAPLSIRPQEAFEYVLYATQALSWSGLLRLPYKLILGSDLYRRWTKIGRFKILSISARSLRVKLTLDDDCEQTRYNCRAVQGMLASVPVGIGLPPAEVKEQQCAADGHESCIYEVLWQNRRSRVALIGIPLIGVVVTLQATLFQGIFDLKDILLTLLAFTTIAFSFGSFRYRRELKGQENLNADRNRYLVDNLKKIEDDYRELAKVKGALEGRTEYLSIINAIGEKVSNESDYEHLLSEIRDFLIERLSFEESEFFRYDPGASAYRGTTGGTNIIPSSAVLALPSGRHHFHLNDPRYSLAHEFTGWLKMDTSAGMLFILPVQVPDVFSGFYCFACSTPQTLSDENVDTLFSNIAEQLKVGFMKIASRATIDAILSSIPEYVLIFSEDSYKVKFANRYFLQSFSGNELRDPDGVVDSSLFTVAGLKPETIENIKSIVGRFKADERSEIFETTIGSSILEYSVFSIPGIPGDEKLSGIILSDVTDAKSFQQKLLTSEKLMALGRVAGGIAHEINNPLYAVLANAEDIVEDTEAVQETRTYAHEIIDHVMTISDVVKDLSAYSKTMRKEQADDINLNTVIDESLKLVRYGTDFLEIEAVTDLRPLPEISVIRGEIQQILINLFTNAIWAMDGRGTLTVSSNAHEGEITISVEDTGIGIPEENIPHIFNYLFTTKSVGEGTGQDLSIVDRLARRNNARIKVESSVGKGTTFSLVFNQRRGTHG